MNFLKVAEALPLLFIFRALAVGKDETLQICRFVGQER